MEKWSERNWFGKVKYIWGCVIIAFIGTAVIFNIVMVYKEYVQPWMEKQKACAEWRESFPDRRLIEIVRKDVDGQTFDQISDFYGVSGGCIEKRINEDRGLYDQLKAQYISRNY